MRKPTAYALATTGYAVAYGVLAYFFGALVSAVVVLAVLDLDLALCYKLRLI